MSRGRDQVLAIYRRALPRVYGYLLPRCGETGLAEDLTAETFLAAVAAADQPDPPEVTVAWLVGVARHKLVDHWRRVGRADVHRRLAGRGALYQTPWGRPPTVRGAPRGLWLCRPADCRNPADCMVRPGWFSLALLLHLGTTLSCCPGSRPNSDTASVRSVTQRRRRPRRRAPLPASGQKLRPRAAPRPSRPAPR
jgi:hypothetical protein